MAIVQDEKKDLNSLVGGLGIKDLVSSVLPPNTIKSLKKTPVNSTNFKELVDQLRYSIVSNVPALPSMASVELPKKS